jgi:hypothetical protein
MYAESKEAIIVRKKNNIIEINGQRYDATTGALLEQASSHHAKPKPPSTAKAHSKPAKSTKPTVTRQPIKISNTHAPKPSRTLMRQAVKKPAPSLKRHLKVQGYTGALIEPSLSSIVATRPVQPLDSKRLRHANKVAKSRLISHFLPPDPNAPIQVPLAPPQPAKAATMPQTPDAAASTHSTKQHRPSKHASATADMLARAIDQATSHEELLPPRPAKHGRAKRNVSIGAAVGLSVLVLGVIVTQNLSNVRLQMASAKAGFNASLPNYKPAGYSLGQLNYSDGVVAAQFRNNSDDLQYSVIQKSSSWNNATLRDTFVTPIDSNYRTIDAGGHTIYLYGERYATWVNDGVWYVIQSNGSLSDRQLVDLATSM